MKSVFEYCPRNQDIPLRAGRKFFAVAQFVCYMTHIRIRISAKYFSLKSIHFNFEIACAIFIRPCDRTSSEAA